LSRLGFFAFGDGRAVFSRFQTISTDRDKFSTDFVRSTDFLPVSLVSDRFSPVSPDFSRFQPISTDFNRFQPISTDCDRLRPIATDCARRASVYVDALARTRSFRRFLSSRPFVPSRA